MEFAASLPSIAAIVFGAPTAVVQRPLSKFPPSATFPACQYSFPAEKTQVIQFPDAETAMMPLDRLVADDTQLQLLCKSYGSQVISDVVSLFSGSLNGSINDSRAEEVPPLDADLIQRVYQGVVQVQQEMRRNAASPPKTTSMAQMIRDYQLLLKLPFEARVRATILDIVSADVGHH
jgi:hypothetical protein